MSFDSYRFDLENHNKQAKKMGFDCFRSYFSQIFKDNEKVAVQLVSSPLFRIFINESKVLEFGANQFFSKAPDVVPFTDTEQITAYCNDLLEENFLVGFKKNSELNGQKMKPFLFSVTTNLNDLGYFKNSVRSLSEQKSEPLYQKDNEHIQINITMNVDSQSCISLMLKPAQLIQIIQPSHLPIRVKMEKIIGKSITDEFDDNELIKILNTAFSITEHIVKFSRSEFKEGLPVKFKLSSSSSKQKIRAKVINRTLK